MSNDDILLGALYEHGPMRSREIADVTGLNRGQLTKSLKRLQKYRFIKLVWGDGKGGSLNYYALQEYEGDFTPPTPPEKKKVSCPPCRRRIIEALKHEELCASELSEVTGCKIGGLYRILRELEENGIIESEFKTRPIYDYGGYAKVWRLVSWQDAHSAKEKQ